MTGNIFEEFVNDILEVGGPEKEFVFRGRMYFLETMYRQEKGLLELYIDEWGGLADGAECLCTYSFWGKDFAECFRRFAAHKIFDGLNIYEAESEIEVLYG